jgi:hypothetical protein
VSPESVEDRSVDECGVAGRLTSSMESPASVSESGDEVSLAVDCFRNYSAAEVFVQSLARQTDQQDVEAILGRQRDL